MANTKSRTPAIRFVTFSDSWKERKLLANFEKIIDFRGRTPKKIGLDWSKSGYLALSALNVKNGYIDHEIAAHYGNQELYDKWMSGNELHKNQVLFTTEAPMGNVAQIPDNNKYILSQRTIAFEVKPKLIAENYLAVFLGTPSLLQKLESLSSGGTAKGVSQKSLASVSTLISKNIKEQTKIGNYFQQLDTLITQHQQKHDKLLNIKKALLEKMFPKQGEAVPEIRFKGFRGEWEEEELANIVDVRSGRDYKHLSSGNIPVYGTGGYMLSVNKALSYNVDAVGIGRKGTIDKPYILKAPFWTVDTLFYAVPNGENNLGFIYSIFQKINWKQKDESTGVPSLSKVAINNIPVCTTHPDEQTKIGNLFKHLDTLLSQHQTQLKKLKNIKQACLEKMFV